MLALCNNASCRLDKAAMPVAHQCHVKCIQQTSSKTTEQSKGLFPDVPAEAFQCVRARLRQLLLKKA